MRTSLISRCIVLAAFIGTAGGLFGQGFSPGPNPITGTVGAQTLSSGTGTINVGGAISVSGSTLGLNMTGTSTLNNDGTIQATGSGRAIDSNSGSANLTITNTGLISSNTADAFRINTVGTSVNLTNSGTIQVTSGGQAIDWAAITTGANTLTNQAMGSITTLGEDAVRPGQNGIVINAGTITATPTGVAVPSGSDGIDLRTQKTVTVTNTGTITGRHGIATDGANVGPSSLTVNNNAGTIQALNGSGLNVDGVSTTVVANVTNLFGATIKGGISAGATDGDGDGIDVDGVLTLNNSGDVLGLGAKGGTNNAEGIAAGGGSITNTATGQIIGSSLFADAPNGDTSKAGNGILIDDSNAGNAVAATTIDNSGLIQGKTGTAIKVIGTFADTITNNATGTIRGAGTGAAIQTGGGNDTINNHGSIIGDNGLAIDMEGGNNTLNIYGGSITGAISGGAGGTNALVIDAGTGNTFTYGGAVTNFSTLEVISGTAALGDLGAFAGTTTVSAGTLEVTANNALGTTTAGTTVANGATLKLNNVNYSTAEALGINGASALVNVGTSTFAGQVTAVTNATINAGGGTLNLTGGVVKNGTTLSIAGGGRVNVSGTGISGASANSDLVVDGTTLVVSAASNYNGPTTVQNSGTLVANAAVTTTQMTVSSNSTLSGTSSITTAGSTNYIYLNGALIVGDSTLGSPVASSLDLQSSGAPGSVVMGTAVGSFIYFDLFQRGGDLTTTAAAADYVRLFGTLDASLGGTLVINNPGSLSGFAAGDKWTLFDLTGPGSITGTPALDYSALSLGGGLTGNFNSGNGVFSVEAVPEPGRALLIMLGMAGVVMRRRRTN